VNLIRGVAHPPERLVVYGPSGVGKSRFACTEYYGGQARQDVLALSYERGLEQIGVTRTEGAQDWDGSMALIKEACTGKHEFKTIVIDTVDRLEDQAAALICKRGKKGQPMTDLAAFGYNDGFEALAAKWRELLFLLEGASPHGREVILIAHVKREMQHDPILGDYGKYVAAIHKLCWGITHRWADAVLFGNYEQGLVEGRAVMTGERSLYTQAGTGFDAKNRWSLPPVLPLSWKSFQDARASARRTPEEVIAAIRAIATQDTKDKAEEFIKKAGLDTPALVRVENALKDKVAK
jgi:AAA domain